MRVKDLRLALDHYEEVAKRASKDPTGIPKNTTLNCYDNEGTRSVANTVKWNIEYNVEGGGSQLNVFEFPWLTLESNPLSPYSVY